ncbi:hypothetical protein VTK73DRAFT_1726 [Phialemonium thermophilum]|uniref:Uncharacterized protein n=1 Tax=Phialemonium thermophilum TaxID=223376 RepID=A0ABR3X8M3_9PEZI
MERKKVIHQLDTPFSRVEWPQISQEHQDAILELLCRYFVRTNSLAPASSPGSLWHACTSSDFFPLLSPIAQHHRSFVTSSKGKRNKSRKRKSSASPSTGALAAAPPPEIASYVDVGLSSISRTLEALTHQACPSAKPGSLNKSLQRGAKRRHSCASLEPYAVVFVARSGQSSAFHSHFPLMVAASSRYSAPDQSIRLVGFSKSCEERLSSCLGMPRVSSIGLREGSNQARGLISYVREHVPAVEAKWLKEAMSCHFLGTKIKTCQVAIGPKKEKKT